MSDLETDPLEKPPISIWKRLLIVGGVFALLVTALGLGQHTLHSARTRNALKEALAHLDETDPGWRLEDIEAARPTLPEDSNSARTVVAASRLKPKGVPDYKVMERIDRQPPLPPRTQPELLDAESLGLLETELKAASAAVHEARKLAETPSGRHRLVYAANPINTLLPDQQKAREIASLLNYDALYLANKGEAKAALYSCRAILNAGRSLGDEPFFISQVVRIACVAVACNAVERTLALGEPPAEDLARLQKLLEEEEKHPTLLIGMRGERAIMHILLEGIASGTVSASEVVGTQDAGLALRERYMRWTIKDMARREHPKMLELMNRAIDNARLPAHEQAAAERTLDVEIKKLAAEGSLLRLLLPGLTKISEATRRQLAHVRCCNALLAAERHRQEKGTWPVRLEDLTPKLLASVPLDPFDGKPLRYRRTANGVIVYSVGPDGVDNGGDIDRTRTTGLPTADLGYRLWDVKHRRQPAKPATLPKPPATPPGGVP